MARNIFLGAVGAMLARAALELVVTLSRTGDVQPSKVTGAAPPAEARTISREMPNVYYILLDAYDRAAQLRNWLNLDNSSFLRQLNDRGFREWDERRSTHVETTFS